VSKNQGLSFRLVILSSLLTLLSACSNEQAQIFAPDPQLQNNPQQTVTPTPTPTSTPTPLIVTPPDNFPKTIPIYSGATLVAVEPQTPQGVTKTRWESSDPSNLIANFYQKELQTNNWKLEQPTTEGDANSNLIARRDNLELKLTFTPSGQKTEILIDYQLINDPVTTNPNPTPTPTPEVATSPGSFGDLEETPPQLRPYVDDLVTLGVLTAANNQPNKFEPNKTITHREYAKWLLQTHNKLYANNPTRQIRLASAASPPAFQDIPKSDPDFPIIQGLAEAGIIPSPLSGDSTSLLFRPEAVVTRQDLLQWKVPLDLGKALPNATLDSIKETWGFQDAAKIDPKAWRSLYADFQNGDQANIRRVFGYTTLFQPKRPVTRAETAAALWYFGFQGEGISASEVLPKASDQPTQ